MQLFIVAVFSGLFLVPPQSAASDILLSPWGKHAGDHCGGAVCAVGDVDNNGVPDFVVGEPEYDVGEVVNAGRAYLYLCERDPFAATEVVLSDTTKYGLFGKELAGIGDVNHDGYDDFLITSEDLYETHLYLGGPTPQDIQELIIPRPEGVRTTTVGGIGDANGDGYDDFIIGALFVGKTFVYLGRPTISTTPDYVISNGGLRGATPFGYAFESLNDLNDDGFDDFAISIYGVTVGDEVHPGVAVFLGGPTIPTEPDYVIERAGGTGTFGHALDYAGDWNGDGYQDLLIDQIDNEVEGGSRDAILVYSFFPEHGFVQTGRIGGTPELNAGPSFDSHADVDGDGLEDIVFEAAPGRARPGVLWVLPGSLHTFGPPYIKIDEGPDAGFYTDTIKGVGDITGDGIPELLVGAPNEGSQLHWGGRAYLLRGGGKRMLRLRAAQTLGPVNGEVVVPISIAVDTDPAAGPSTLAALDLALKYNLQVMTFLSAELVHATGEWLMEAADNNGTVTIAMAGVPPQDLAGSEEPFLALHFALGTEPGSTQLTLAEGRAMASYDLPVFFTFESGWIIASAATNAPPIPGAASIRSFPNPFNPRTTLALFVPERGPVALRIYDLRGREVWKMPSSNLDAGEHRILWTGVDRDARALPSGVYFAQARGSNWRATTRLLLLR